MTNAEVNKYIHEQIMGKCWGIGYDFASGVCSECSEPYRVHQANRRPYGTDYCSDASPRSLLNEVVAKVIKMVGRGEFYGYLQYQVMPTGDLFSKYWITTAKAEQIARACVEAHKAGAEAG